ncbi:hypothetical protein D3C72_1366180 [compost metagenome]
MWRPRPDAQGKEGASGDIAHEEIGFVARHIPGLGCVAVSVVLLLPQRRGVGGQHMQIKHGYAGAHPHAPLWVHNQAVGGRTGQPAHGGQAARDIVDAEVAGPAAGVVVGDDLPVVAGKRARTGVFKLDAQVVFLQAQGVEAKALVIDAVKPHADAALHDLVVGDQLVFGGKAEGAGGL